MKTVPVKVGPVTIGGGAPLVLQSMTNTSTMDTATSVAQILSLHRAGASVVRLTAPSMRDAENLEHIVREVRARGGAGIGIVADVHFSPEIAMVAARYVDKVRINPGNFKQGGNELQRLIALCRERGVALRIGVNHGSLAPEMVDRYGDTPEGMVASAMEFLRVCRSEGFDQVVVSMKSSNVRVMVYAYRMLAAAMRAEGMRYPLHLGVTEAGDGLQGRVKSSVGIGALLAEGLGDTIRVSLAETPENEIPVAALLADHFKGFEAADSASPVEYFPRTSTQSGRLGDGQVPLLHSEMTSAEVQDAVVMEASPAVAAPEWRRKINELPDKRPVILHRNYGGIAWDELVVKASADFGPIFLDGLADGIWIENAGTPQQDIDALCYQILQASRARITQTEYIACPGCGRTLYDMQGTLAAIKARTAHLVGLKIGVMGCIVNGPGEMADADYGYVGSGSGKVTLYKGKQVIRRNIPEREAIEALLELIETDDLYCIGK